MPASVQQFQVDAPLVGAALAAAVRQWHEGMTWSQAKDLIRNRRVLVNDVVCLDEGRRLQSGERVSVTTQRQDAPPTGNDLTIRYLDRQIVVVEKPAGMRTIFHSSERAHSRERQALQPTVQGLLPELIARREQGKNSGKRRGTGGSLPAIKVVHRIDRDTSGLLVFARTEPAFERLMETFKQHTVDRTYLTVVPGQVVAQTFVSELVDDRGDGRRGSTTLKGTGKRAVTHVTPVEAIEGYTVLQCRLETGRTHQIRIHLSEAGHPVCGDTRYHQPLYAPPIADKSGAPRLALHAMRLGFVHPTTENPLSFEMPLPQDLTRWLNRLRSGVK
jgi:23S rRNA pseudouridine1911/1915/1917 synthase